ncbi:MAG: cation-transporting P-type ATPase, partial [Thiohalomonadales bacterium]|nr:cation-transporting P-type ATPase [Thiohalomonadales bacterium]
MDVTHTDDYKKQSVQETSNQLQVDLTSGLKGSEVQTRLQRYGYNEIKEKEEPLWHRIFRRFWGPIPWMIEVAA